MKPHGFLIAGRRLATPETVAVRNPYNDATVGEACLAGFAEIGAALEAAEKAAVVARGTTASERSRLLRRIADAIGARAEEFAALILAEAGKPVSLARAEVERARATFEFAAAAALDPLSHPLAMDATAAGAGHTGLAKRFPLGLILGITPFNFPLNLVAHKIAPCLATGNTMILKPALKTPLTALLLAEVMHGCGTPPGQIAVLPFDHAYVRDMLRGPRVKMLSFTGGAEAGWQLKAQAVKQRVTLELGGNAAALVDSDSDWHAHVPKMVFAAFSYAGQSCISLQRVFVHEPVYKEFREAFVSETRAGVVTGDPADPATVCGPMISREALERTIARIKEAEAAGGRLLAPLRADGPVLHPAVMENVPCECALAREEVFAPVVLINRCADFAEGLAEINRSRFGLQAGVFTRDPDKIVRAFDALEVGGVLINQVPAFRTENMPYGGVKDSGVGREGVRYAMEEMTELKSLVINTRGD